MKAMQAFRKIIFSQPKYRSNWISKRHCSSSVVPVGEVVERRNYLFSQEQKRQLEEVGRVEKIAVEIAGPPEDLVVVVNKDISTPYDCCRHISLPLCQRTPLALIDDKYLWDMHRPLPGECRIKFLSFRDNDPFSLNQVFWRTGSFVLGAVISKAFRDDISVLLHSFPHPFVKSGSFVYDVQMNIKGWTPTEDELKILSGEFLKFVYGNHKIERLQVKKSLAMEIFEGNPIKQSQIPKIAAKAEDHLVTLYRVADHIDISCGPMVADTSFFGRCAVLAAHYMGTVELYRFQAVALPKGIMLNSHAFDVLIRRGSFLNEAPIPGLEQYGDTVIHRISDTDVNPDPRCLQV